MAEKTIDYIKLPDGETYKIGGGSGFNLFDTKVSDHILEGDEALGWALQGTYVYKEAIAGSRYGYPDFYAKVVEEYTEAISTETVNGVEVKVHSNGHKYYDIANKSAIDTFFNTMGSAWFYGVDTENERVFLPRDTKARYLVKKKESTSSDPTWYNLYSDGWLEQGGLFTATKDGYNIVYLLQEYKNTDFTVTTTSNKSYTSGSNTSHAAAAAYGAIVQNITSISFDVYAQSSSQKAYWRACGYAEKPQTEDKLLYICVGNTKVESAITNVTEITTSENDTLPLFYNFYSKEDMTTTGAYVNASLGSWLSGNVYTTAYNELVNKLGTDNVKAVTDSYTDYDFVVNQDDMTFRLPLLNGDENIVDYSKATAFKLATNFTAPANGVINTSTNAYSGDMSWYWTINGGEKHYIGENQSGIVPVTVSVSKDDVFYITGVTDNSNTLYFYPYKGNGNLYYKLSNAVTNLELLDVAKVTADLNTCYKRNSGDNSDLSALGMPSKTRIDLTLGASGTTYTAPANGWFSCSSEGVVNLLLSNQEFSLTITGATGYAPFGYMPVKKGEKFVFSYSGNSNNKIRFFYAEGEV